MKMDKYYNKKRGNNNTMEWADVLEDRDYKVIKQELLENGKWVSTVRFGLDHNFGEGEPLFFLRQWFFQVRIII